MGKTFLLAIVAIGVAVNPEMRTHLMPYTEQALAPVYEWSTRSRVGEIARALESEAARGAEVPGDERSLASFVAGRYGEAEATDPWGAGYFLDRDLFTVRVASAGRDGLRGTPDDILSTEVHLPGL